MPENLEGLEPTFCATIIMNAFTSILPDAFWYVNEVTLNLFKHFAKSGLFYLHYNPESDMGHELFSFYDGFITEKLGGLKDLLISHRFSQGCRAKSELKFFP